MDILYCYYYYIHYYFIIDPWCLCIGELLVVVWLLIQDSCVSAVGNSIGPQTIVLFYKWMKGSSVLPNLCPFLFLIKGQILPPRNLSLVWEDDFKPVLTWKPAQPGCTYRVQSETKTKNEKRQVSVHIFTLIHLNAASAPKYPTYEGFWVKPFEYFLDMHMSMHCCEQT